MANRPRLLVVDDGLEYSRIVAEQLPEFELISPSGEGEPPRLGDGPSALRFLQAHRDDVDVVLLDMHFDIPEDQLLPLAEGVSLRRTKRFQGVAILRELRRFFPGCPPSRAW